MSYRETEHLRVLIANERKDRLALVAPMVANLGHEVIAREIDVPDVGVVTARERPDVALVGLGKSSEHALALIDKIVQEAACPVILLIHAPDPAFVKEASKRGIFAYITDAEVDDWQSAIDIVLRRFTEYHDLEGAFGRRAVTERAKGILMERQSGRRDLNSRPFGPQPNALPSCATPRVATSLRKSPGSESGSCQRRRAGDGTRTRAETLEGSSATATPRPRGPHDYRSAPTRTRIAGTRLVLPHSEVGREGGAVVRPGLCGMPNRMPTPISRKSGLRMLWRCPSLCIQARTIAFGVPSGFRHRRCSRRTTSGAGRCGCT